MQKNTLVIVGNIASGKSTATKIIANELGLSYIDADDLFQTTDPFREVYLENMSRWAFANELWLTVERVKLIQEQQLQKTEEITVIDSGLLMSWVYTYSHYLNGVITPNEWKLYEELYNHLATHVLSSMMVVKLGYTVPTLMKRIQKRARQYELDFYTEDYLSQIDTGLKALDKVLAKKKIKTLHIAEESIADFESSVTGRDSLLTQVKAHIRK